MHKIYCVKMRHQASKINPIIFIKCECDIRDDRIGEERIQEHDSNN